MNRRIESSFISVAILLTVGALSAHHGYEAVFDSTKKVTLTGTLTKVDWRNPHIELSLDAKNDRGGIDSWAIESGPPNFFRNRNIPKDRFVKAIGQTVTIEALRARDGSLLGSLLKITFADGTSVVSNPRA